MITKDEIITHASAGTSVVSSYLLGMSTQQLGYLVIAVVGLLVSIWSATGKGRTEKLEQERIRQEMDHEDMRLEWDRQRHEAVMAGMKGDRAAMQQKAPEIAEKINAVLDEAKIDANVTSA